MTVQSVLSGKKPHQNNLLLLGQQVIATLCDLCIVSALMSLHFAEADIVMPFFSGTLLCKDVACFPDILQ